MMSFPLIFTTLLGILDVFFFLKFVEILTCSDLAMLELEVFIVLYSLRWPMLRLKYVVWANTFQEDFMELVILVGSEERVLSASIDFTARLPIGHCVLFY